MRYNLIDRCSSNLSTAMRNILPYPYIPKDSCLSELLTTKVIEKNRTDLIENNEKNSEYYSEMLEFYMQMLDFDAREHYEKIFERYSNNRMISCKLRIAYCKQDSFEGMACALLAEKHEKKSVFYLPRPNKDYDERMASLESLLGDGEDAKIHGNSALMTTGAGFMKNLSRTAYFALPLAALTSAALVGIARSLTLWNFIWTSVIAESIEETYITNLPDIEKQEKALVERAKKMDSILSDLSDKYGDALLSVL
ncbi:MAG: hypothetical protein NTV63_00215 [Candidatus Woesearchaeota archaeon]|nr:hypothetical protein [Candidatus Woesearchaeota archaeon]